VSGIAVAAAVVVVVRAKHEADSSDAGVVTAPAGSRFDGAVLPSGIRAPRVALRDQDGRPATTAGRPGRPLVVALLYTGCTSCHVIAQQLKGALDDLRRPVPALAVSLDPSRDSPARARAFLADVGLTGRMRFLLGPRRELARAWRGFAAGSRHGSLAQQVRLVLVDAGGMQRVAFPAAQATPERIAHDLRALGAR
jgi:cytochrome oxidase Cu insertion factor (SCO1/SenC/PrrC family)